MKRQIFSPRRTLTLFVTFLVLSFLVLSAVNIAAQPLNSNVVSIASRAPLGSISASDVRAPSAPSIIFLPFVGKAPTCVGTGSYDDTDSSITYTGNWQLYSGTGPFNNTMHYSDVVGESISFLFCGNQVTVIYASGLNGGTINVSIDGISVGTIDAYSANVQWQQQWVSSSLVNGMHTLTLTHATGSRVNLDAINVTAPLSGLSSICVTVYYDMNGNRIKDAGEPLLRGAGIVIKNSSNVTVGSFVSYETTARCVNDLPADTYSVSESPNAPAFASTTNDTVSVSLSASSTANVYFGDSVSQPNGMVVDATRNHLFITSKDTGWLLAWDETDNRTLMTISAGTEPWGVGLVNDRVFVAEYGSKVVAVVDAATFARIKDINLAPTCWGEPSHVAVNPNTKQVYVAVHGSPGRIAIIDAVTLNLQCVALPIPQGDGTMGVAVNTALNQLYVTSRDGQSMFVYDISSGVGLGSPIQTVSLGGQAYHVQTKSSTNQVYLTLGLNSPDYDTVTTLRSYTSTVSGVTLATTATISNTHDGGEIFVSQKNGNLYVAATQDNRLQIINPVTLAISQTITMTNPFAITENINLGRIYIGNRNANLITTVSDNLP